MSNENPNRDGTPLGILERVRHAMGRLTSSDATEAATDETASTSEPVSNGSRHRSGAPTPLTDEERIRRYLRPHGGRMKQSALVECTEWSKSKVSRLLSAMEEEGQIVRTQVGREKIVSLPGQQPEAARSPFDTADRATDERRVTSE